MKELNPIFEFRGKKYKVCNICEEKLPVYRYNKSSVKKSGLRGECKGCQLITKSRFDKNKTYDPVYEKNRKLLRLYGISFNDFNEMLLKQNNECTICGCCLKGDKNTHVDHCHKTGKVRSLLCSCCNTTLGKVDDNINILEKMIIYLKNYDQAK